jgi:ribonuclease HI
MQQLAERISFIWVKGHATSDGNVLVDQLLNQAMDNL